MNDNFDHHNQLCITHNCKLECMSGRSAHPSNWYCEECDKENEANTEKYLKINELTVLTK